MSDLENIYQSALKFLIPSTAQETYKTIVHEALRLTGAKCGSIFLATNGVLQRVYASSPLLYKIKIRKKGYTYTAFKTRRPFILSTGKLEEIHPEFKKLHAGSDLNVPLSYARINIGVLSVQSPKGVQFNDKQLSRLKLFAPLATLAIRKSHLYSQLEKALKDKDLFISIAGHELRTPITTISAYTQLIIKALSQRKKPTLQEVKTLSEELKRLTKLVNELLQTDRIKHGALEFNKEKCDIKLILKKAITNFTHIHPQRTVSLKSTLKVDSFVYADPDRLLQAILNLLNNAEKFSSKDSKIDIFLNDSPSTIILKMRDYGKGIAKDDQKRIFERYYRGKEAPNSGMGLGLYLVKHIVENHSGKIKVYSQVNNGTTFVVSLPKFKSDDA